jgi:DNA-binding FadR family transcriptional regulator
MGSTPPRPLAVSRRELEERLARLAAQGLVSREVRGPAAFEDFRPIATRQSVSQALVEDREDRS